MSSGKPYNDAYMAEFRRLCDEQAKAAGHFAAHVLYLREEKAGRRIPGTRPEVRERLAEQAAQEWLRLAGEIEALNAAEYRKKYPA